MRHHTWDLKTGCVPVSDKAYALRPKPKKNAFFPSKIRPAGWNRAGQHFRLAVANPATYREIDQMWDGAASPGPQIAHSGLYWDLLVGLLTVLMAG